MAVRDGNIDFAKGCAIVSMVIGHVYSGATGAFVNLFHMSFFLVASGLFFDSQACERVPGLFRLVKKRFWRLYFPYVFWTIVFILLNNMFLDIHFLADESTCGVTDGGQNLALSSYITWHDFFGRIPRVLVMKDWTLHTGPCWFLITLVYVSVGYGVITHFLSRVTTRVLLCQTILSICLVFLARHVSGHSCFGIRIGVGGRNLAAYALFHFGVLLRSVDLHALWSGRRRLLLLFCGSLGTLVFLHVLGCQIVLALNKLDGVGVLFLAAASGFVFLYSGAILVNDLSVRLANAVRYVGRMTMPILIFHWTAISLVSLVGCVIFNLPADLIAVRPVGLVSFGWRICYVICGIGIPLVLGEVYSRVKRLRIGV